MYTVIRHMLQVVWSKRLNERTNGRTDGHFLDSSLIEVENSKKNDKNYFLCCFYSYCLQNPELRSQLKHFFYVKLHHLTLSRRRSLSYRSQSIDVLCKSMNWFLYDMDLRHERVNVRLLKGLFFLRHILKIFKLQVNPTYAHISIFQEIF